MSTPEKPVKLSFNLSDWQSTDAAIAKQPIPTELTLNNHRIDIKFQDGRSIWIEQENGVIQVHNYLSDEADSDDPLTLRIGQTDFIVEEHQSITQLHTFIKTKAGFP